MSRKVLVASALVALLIVPAQAAEPPANAEACHKLRSDMSDAVSRTVHSAGAKTKLDGLFTKLNDQCTAAALDEAGFTVAAIRYTAGIKH